MIEKWQPKVVGSFVMGISGQADRGGWGRKPLMLPVPVPVLKSSEREIILTMATW